MLLVGSYGQVVDSYFSILDSLLWSPIFLLHSRASDGNIYLARSNNLQNTQSIKQSTLI